MKRKTFLCKRTEHEWKWLTRITAIVSSISALWVTGRGIWIECKHDSLEQLDLLFCGAFLLSTAMLSLRLLCLFVLDLIGEDIYSPTVNKPMKGKKK